MLTLRIARSLACSLPLVLLTLGSVSAAPNASAQMAESFPEDSATYIAQNSNVIMQTQGILQRGDRTLNDGSLFHVHTFNGRAGQQVTINLESNEFDTYLMLLDSNSQKIAENDDAYGTTNSSITIVLPQTGEYLVIANGYDRNSRGRYQLTISEVRDNASTFNLSNMPDGYYKFEGPPSNHLTPEVEPVILIHRSGNRVIGLDIQFMAENPCMSGVVSGNSIIQVTWASYLYGEGGWETGSGRPINLNNHRFLSNQFSEREHELLQSCLDYFNNRR